MTENLYDGMPWFKQAHPLQGCQSEGKAVGNAMICDELAEYLSVRRDVELASHFGDVSIGRTSRT